jgi:hypothetical protein
VRLGFIDQVAKRGHKTQTCTPFVPFCLSIFVNPTFLGERQLLLPHQIKIPYFLYTMGPSIDWQLFSKMIFSSWKWKTLFQKLIQASFLTKYSFHFFVFRNFSKHNEKHIKVFVDYYLENIFGN